MKVCKNSKELYAEIMKRVNIALDTDVADVVKDVMTDHIAQDVYDVYEPKAYNRRLNQDGLLDPNNIISTIDGEGRLKVENVTLGSKYYYDNGQRKISQNSGEPIAEVIETGQGYDIHGWEYDGVPRPFMKNTHDDLEQNHYHTEAMKQSLKKQGLEVK